MLVLLCLAVTPALAEELSIEGITDGIALAENGYLDLFISGGKPNMVYQGTLAITNMKGEEIERSFAYVAQGNTYNLWEMIAGIPGDYGPFTLTISRGNEEYETQFMCRVPEGTELYTNPEDNILDSEYSSTRECAFIPPLSPAKTANIHLESPLDKCVVVGKPGYSLQYSLEMGMAGIYRVMLYDVTEGKMVDQTDLHADSDDMWWMPSLNPEELISGHMYQLSVSFKDEIAYIHFIAVDEDERDGNNPWEQVETPPQLVRP